MTLLAKEALLRVASPRSPILTEPVGPVMKILSHLRSRWMIGGVRVCRKCSPLRIWRLQRCSSFNFISLNLFKYLKEEKISRVKLSSTKVPKHGKKLLSATKQFISYSDSQEDYWLKWVNFLNSPLEVLHPLEAVTLFFDMQDLQSIQSICYLRHQNELLLETLLSI